jgi:hypothetical protein
MEYVHGPWIGSTKVGLWVYDIVNHPRLLIHRSTTWIKINKGVSRHLTLDFQMDEQSFMKPGSNLRRRFFDGRP